MKFIEVLKHNFVLVPVVASVIFGTFTGIKYIVDVSNTIHTSEVEVQSLLQELKETQARVEDAICATKAAIKQGIVPGGGIALLNASKLYPTSEGEKILYLAIQAPFKTILSNSIICKNG